MIEIKEKTGYIVTSVERSEGDKFVLEEGSIILGYEPLYSGTDEERFRDWD